MHSQHLTVTEGPNVSLCSPESPPPMTLKQVWNLRHGTPATPTLCALQRWWAWWVLVYACVWMVVTTPTTSGDWSTRQTSNRSEPARGTETCSSHRWVSVFKLVQPTDIYLYITWICLFAKYVNAWKSNSLKQISYAKCYRCVVFLEGVWITCSRTAKPLCSYCNISS